MLAAAEDLRFEYAAQLRDELRELRRDLQEIQPSRPRRARSGWRDSYRRHHLGWPPWTSIGRQSNVGTSQLVAADMTRPRWTSTCGRSLRSSRSCSARRARAAADMSLASTAGTQVQSILQAAETAAAEIERHALENARQVREEADATPSDSRGSGRTRRAHTSPALPRQPQTARARRLDGRRGERARGEPARGRGPAGGRPGGG